MNTPTDIVRTLLEDDQLDIRGMVDELFDLSAVSRKFKEDIEDDLYDSGWLSLQLYPSSYGEETWGIEGSFFDKAHRQQWGAAGARAISAPEFSAIKKAQLVSFAKRTFMKAAKKAGYVVTDVVATEFKPVYDTLDLESAESTLGDWYVTLDFKIDLPVASMHDYES